MAKKWSDVAASAAFQALSFEEQEEARRQYFEEVVSPQVPEADRSFARDQFFADTAPRKPAQAAAPGSAMAPLGNPMGDDFASTIPLESAPPKPTPFFVPEAQEKNLPESAQKFNRVNRLKAKAENTPSSFADEAKDFGLSFLQGAMDVAALPVAGYEQVTGDKESAIRRFFRRGQDAADQLKSEKAQARQAATKAAIDAAENWQEALAAGIVEGFSDPSNTAQTLARMLPQIVAGGGAGRLVEAGVTGLTNAARALPVAAAMTGRAAGLAEATASTVGAVQSVASKVASSPVGKFIPSAATAGAVGSAAVMQGDSVGEEVYKALTEDQGINAADWSRSDPGFKPVYDRLLETPIKELQDDPFFKKQLDIGSDFVEPGEDPQDRARKAWAGREAMRIRAADIANSVARKAAGISIFTNALPGGSAIETALLRRSAVKEPTRNLFERVTLASAKEGLVSEPLEEGGGAYVGALGKQQAGLKVDPMMEAAAAAGQAVAPSVIAGGGAGAFHSSPARPSYEPAQPLRGEASSSSAAPTPRTPESFAAEIAAGKKLETPEDQQFYQNNAQAIEAELQRLAGRSGASSANFTPPDSPTKQAGLVDIEVPLPGAETAAPLGPINPTTEQQFGLDKLRMGGVNVGTTGIPRDLAGAGSSSGGGVSGGSLGTAGLGADSTAGLGGGVAGGVRADDRSAVPPRSAAGQQDAGLNQKPAKIWAGRAGDGYVQPEDAQQALPGLQRKYPDLSWNLQQDADGKYFWSGMTKGASLEASTSNTTETAGQAGASVGALASESQAAAGQAGGAAVATKLPGLESAGLRTAPTAPIREISALNTALQKESGITVAPVATSDMSDQQKLASAVARLMGKTLTVVRQESGAPQAMPNGMINLLGGKHIYIAENAEDAPLFVAVHEAYHGLPEDKRKVLNAALLETFKQDKKQDFLSEFNYSPDRFDEEAPAMIAQAVSKREDFWQDLRTKMGNKEFGEVAKVILAKLGDVITGARKQYGDDFVNKYISDIAKARDLLSTAYADSMQEQGLKPDVEMVAQPMASSRSSDVNALGMYSELARKLDAGPNQAPADQWKAYVKGLPQKGVKPDEIEWSGVNDFLDLKRAAGQKVTKAEVADYLKQGGVKVQETVLGDGATSRPNYGVTFLDDDNFAVVEGDGIVESGFGTEQEAEAWIARQPDVAGKTKYGQYTLPGGENYREVLLTLPEKKPVRARSDFIAEMKKKYGRDDWYKAASEGELLAFESLRDEAIKERSSSSYTSGHWDQYNVLAHIRVNDRTDADGKRVLFVEELQSDWGQEGKKKGFDVKAVSAEKVGEPKTVTNPGFKDQYVQEWVVRFSDGKTKQVSAPVGADPVGIENFNLQKGGTVPLAPFVTKTEGWLNLALKRIAVMAAEGGYDRVAFVNGEQSADRYDLSKQVSRIVWNPETGNFYATPRQGEGRIERSGITAEKLPDIIGKEAAEQLVSEKSRAPNGTHVLKDGDLKVGGEGMKTFYDQIVPQAVKKLLPKLGGDKLGAVKLPTGSEYQFYSGIKKRTVSGREMQPQLGFDVTDAMRERVATTGLPMFSSRAEEPEIGRKLRARVESDFPGAQREYAGLKETKGGRLLDTDIARELSPEYRADRTRSADVHEAASDFIQRNFEHRLGEAKPLGEVVFMAGGGGAGKSSAETMLKPLLDRSHTIYDGTLSSYDKAERNIQMALDAGQRVTIAYVYREPEEAFRNGVLTRAMKKGRTVPIDAVVKGHAGSSEVVRKLQDKFGDNELFRIRAIDNSRGPGNATMLPLSDITPVIKSGLKERLENAAREEFDAGRISEDVYRATAQGRSDSGAAGASQATNGEVRPGVEGVLQERGGPEPARNPVAGSRRGTQRVGDFDVRTMKDGTIVVYGESESIRSQIPDDVKGRVTSDGIVFTTSAAPRVKAALEGRKTAYSRGGTVLEKLPMKDGKYVGAPEKYNTPAKIATLRKSLRKLTAEGERGRYWYENSSREVLAMVGGNVQEARKFVALLAIYSPQAKVDANSTFALRAWAQYRAGQPISVKTGVMDNKARAAMEDVDAFWSGEKTGNFFFNLLREIDPSTAGKQGATIDMWMMRAGEYNNDAPTATQYAFMENETNRLAQELGWEPQQVQAAIWVAMKARMENAGVKKRTDATSEKNGWIRFDYPLKKGKPVKTRIILDAKAHRNNWLKHAFQHVPTKSDTEKAKFDFSDGVRRHIGQISWEARPGRSTGVLPGVNDAPYDQQVEFQQAVQRALLDDDGVDLLAYKLGLLVDGPDILAPGIWQGEVAAGMQKLVAMAPAKGGKGKTSLDPAQKKALDAYAAMLGLLLRQEGVGYHRPFYKGTVSGANGVDINVGRTLTPQEAQALWGAIDQRMAEAGVKDWEDGAGMISSPTGIRVVNFGAMPDNVKFHSLIKDAAATLAVEELELVRFATDGDLITNNWKSNPNGEDYRQRIGAAGSPDLLGWARGFLAPRVQAVFDEFSSRYGWGDPGTIQFSQRARPDAAGGGRDRGVGSEDLQGQVTPSYGTPREGASAAVGYHYSTQPRTTLNSGMYGTGLRGAEMARLDGADPRLKQRVYFYIDRGTGINPEAGVGGQAHRVNLQNLYDVDEDALRLRRDSDGFNAFEAAVLDAGFDGYMVRDAGPSGNAVLLGRHNVPVEQLGGKGRIEKTGQAVAPARERVLNDAEKISANKLLPAGQVTGKRWAELISRAMPDVYERLADNPVWQSDKTMYRSDLAKELQASAPKPTFKKDPEVAKLFAKLQDTRGLGRVRALEEIDAHPMAATIRKIDTDFIDILDRLESSGLIQINCK